MILNPLNYVSRHAKILIFFITMFYSYQPAVAAQFQTPCDFKGISVGDTMTPNQIMSALGITNFKINPYRPSYEEMHPMIEKFGIAGAFELIDEKIGSSCDKKSCMAYLEIGNNIPAGAFFSINPKTNVIDAIEIRVNRAHWDDLVAILKIKFGSGWTTEKERMTIANYQTSVGSRSGKRTDVDRVILTHRAGGKNVKTSASCEIMATNYDMIFEHPGRLGLYHSVVDIKLISTNF